MSINCPQHRKENVLYACTHSLCNSQPLVCAACPDIHSDHQQSLQPFNEWIKSITKNIESGQQQQQFLVDQMQKYQQLLKWCEDDEMHLRKVEEHCRAQKALISEDIREARNIFSEMCNEIQQKLDAQLEEFFRSYKEAFKYCKNTIDESIFVYRKFQPYINPNNLLLRFCQSNTRECMDFSQGLTRMNQQIIMFKQDKRSFIEKLTTVSEKLTELTYNLPVYQFDQGLDTICKQLIDILHNNFQTKLICNIPSFNNNKENQNTKNSIQQQQMIQPMRLQTQNYTLQQNQIINKPLLAETTNLDSTKISQKNFYK